ncbi:ATP-binding protein [Candidatus Woesearchaeota archaeon]|nr:ATP-binding protein [Candidatus Woesearchaeota archaeon]
MENNFKDWKMPVVAYNNYFGRQELLRSVLSVVYESNPTSIELIGDKRIGKTSFINIISKKSLHDSLGFDSSRRFFLIVDLQLCCIRNLSDFYLNILDLLISELEGTEGSVYQDLIAKIRELLCSDSIKDLEFRRICRSLHKLNTKLVVIFDEFQMLDSLDLRDLNFFDALRALQTAQYIMYITTSVKSMTNFVPSSLTTSDFFSYFDRIFIGNLDYDSTKSMILELAKRDKCELDEEDAKSILMYSGTHPVLVKIVAYYYIKNNKELDDKVKEKVQLEAKQNLDHWWNSLTNNQQLLLLNALRSENLDPNAPEVVELIKRGSLVAKEEVKLSSPLLADYLITKEDRAKAYLKSMFGGSWDLLSSDNKKILYTAEITYENHSEYPEAEIDWDSVINEYRKVFESQIKISIFEKIKEHPTHVNNIIEEECQSGHPNSDLARFLNSSSNHLELGTMAHVLRANSNLRGILQRLSGNSRLLQFNPTVHRLPNSLFCDTPIIDDLNEHHYENLVNVLEIVNRCYRREAAHGELMVKDICNRCRKDLITEKKILKKILQFIT